MKLGEIDPSKAIRLKPCWPSYITCPSCAKRKDRHDRQEDDLRIFRCGCGIKFYRGPIAWHVLINGKEIVVPVDSPKMGESNDEPLG